jgi:hypothetical protein
MPVLDENLANLPWRVCGVAPSLDQVKLFVEKYCAPEIDSHFRGQAMAGYSIFLQPRDPAQNRLTVVGDEPWLPLFRTLISKGQIKK